MTILAEILPGIIGGILAPLFAYRVLLLYQLSAYRLKELRTAVKRKRPAYFLLSPIAASVCFAVCAAVFAKRLFCRHACVAADCGDSGGGQRAFVRKSQTRVYRKIKAFHNRFRNNCRDFIRRIIGNVSAAVRARADFSGDRSVFVRRNNNFADRKAPQRAFRDGG